MDLSPVAAEVHGYVDEWRNVLGAQIPDARRILRRLLKQPVTFTPRPDEGIYTFQGVASLGELLAGTIPPTSMASLMLASWNQIASWLQQIDGLRRAA